MSKNKYFGLIALLLLSFLLTYICFGNLIAHLNTGIINTGGDGVKNYFTYLYYIKYDTGNHFSGMNYPFGEHIVFTDNMPIISGGIKFLSKWFPSISDYALGIMHSLLLLSVIFCCYYLYKILRHFKVGTVWAVLSAVFICFFSPQMFKIFGHYGMGFVMMIPFVMYHLIRYETSRKYKHLVYIFILTVVLGFVHLYNLAIIIILLGFYGISWIIVNRKTGLKEQIKFLSPLLIIAIVAFGISAIYLKSTDTIKDRPDYPYGVLSHETIGKDILRADVPLGNVLGKPQPLGSTEGTTYVGLVTLLVVVSSIVLFFVNKKRKTMPAVPTNDFKLWIWVAFFQLLFAMGVPFVWARDFFADHISIFRQFRTLGRFSWPFYYIIMLYSAIFIYRLYSNLMLKNKKLLGYGLLTSVLAIWSLQLYGYVKYRKQALSVFQENYNWMNGIPNTNWNDWLKSKNLAASDFQAVLGLPFFHIGSEKLWLMDVNEGFNMGNLSRLSYQTGIPFMNVMMSRTSWSQTFASVNIIDGPFNKKEILKNFNEKPLLILVDQTFPLASKEKEWLNAAHLIGMKDSTIAVYSLNVSQYLKQNQQYRDSVMSLVKAQKNTEGILGDSVFYSVNHYTDNPNGTTFMDRGSYNPKIKEPSALLQTIVIPHGVKDSLYNLSFWVKNNMKDYRGTYYFIKQYDSNNNELNFAQAVAKYSSNVKDGWFFIDKDIVLQPNVKKIEITLNSENKEKDYLAIDEMLFFPQKSIYFYKSPEGKIAVNNRIQ